MLVARSLTSPHLSPPVRIGFRRLGLVASASVLLSTLLSGCGGHAEYAPQSVSVTRVESGGAYKELAAYPPAPGDPGDVTVSALASDSDEEVEFTGDSDNKKMPAPPPPPSQGPRGSSGESPKDGAQPGTTPRTASPSDDPDRKQPVLIYRADFTMSVYEVQKSLDALESLAKSSHGFLSRRDDHSITLRIPAERFADVLSQIEKIGDVLHRDVVSEDVTAEYRDLEIQLENALVLRTRLEKILEKATKVEEALQVERELARLTTDIERIKGRLKLLTDLSRYSTVTVRFQARSSEVLQKGPFVLPLPWLNNLGLGRLRSL